MSSLKQAATFGDEPGPASQAVWLLYEDAILARLEARLGEWREKGCPPPETYFTSGLERYVAVALRAARLGALADAADACQHVADLNPGVLYVGTGAAGAQECAAMLRRRAAGEGA